MPQPHFHPLLSKADLDMVLTPITKRSPELNTNIHRLKAITLVDSKILNHVDDFQLLEV